MRPPILDIVVLVHDRVDWADLCIRSVESFTLHPYRLIVVDSASEEEKTKRWLHEIEDRGHTVLRLAENRSFSHGINAGVRLGAAPFIVILNDDAIVTEGWDTSIVQDASPARVGLVGAKSNFASGAQSDPNFIGEPPYLVFVCVGLRRAVWDEIGPMDEETFDGFNSEDLDYAWRVSKAGYKLAVSSAFVLHAGSRTLGAAGEGLAASGIPTEKRARADAKYHARLFERWGKKWIDEHMRLSKRVLVTSYHAEDWTRVDFAAAFINLKAYGGYTFNFYQSKRVAIAAARNAVADYALDQGYDFLVQIDDDAIFPPDLIRRLIVHDKDVVCALAYQRKPPFLPCAYEIAEENGLLGHPIDGMEHTGLRKVDVSGFHCSIMRTSVIKRLRDGLKGEKEGDPPRVPGTRLYYGGFDNKVGEDFAFSLNCKKIGIQIYVDTDLIAGHIGDSIVVDEAYRKRYVQGG